MRTTLDLPEDILEMARRAAGLRTKREPVVARLEELVQKLKREELRRLDTCLSALTWLDPEEERALERGRRRLPGVDCLLSW
jgi:Arc/MetJ family transcription regulator